MKTAEQIAKVNDDYRKKLTATKNFRIMLTQGVNGLEEKTVEVLKLVKNFDTFTEDNDPYKEHDFGKVTFGGENYFWKIDYYDNALEYGADPHEDEDLTRVMTIMRADEY